MASITEQTQQDKDLEKLAYAAQRQKAEPDTCHTFDDIVAYIKKYHRPFPMGRELSIAEYGEINPDQSKNSGFWPLAETTM